MYETNIATTLSQSEAFNHLSALLIPVVLFLVQSCPVHSKGVLKAEMMETLVYGCVTWTLGKEHFADLRTAYHRFLPLYVSFASSADNAQTTSSRTPRQPLLVLTATGEIALTQTDRPYSLFLYGCSSVVSADALKKNNKTTKWWLQTPRPSTRDERRPED